MNKMIKEKINNSKIKTTLELYYLHNRYCTVILEFLLHPICNVHCDMYKWNINTYKELLKDWKDIIEIMKERNCTEVIATYDSSSGNIEKWKKFIKLFNFPESMTVYISKRRL